MERSITPYLIKSLQKKIVLLSGPRQAGKTYLSKSLFANYVYLNFDSREDQIMIQEKSWSRDSDLIVFDEIHKMKMWKTYVKGIYDKEGVRPRLIVTGSARLDVHRKAGDSLAGRHQHFRLLPFSLRESKMKIAKDSIQNMLKLGTFPEPLLGASDREAALWRKSYIDAILRQDLLDYKTIRDFKSVEILVQLLSERVTSTVSYSSLARDLLSSPNTIKSWIELLESLFLVFKVTPYSKNISKAILKEPKIYFFDVGRVTAGLGAQLENLVALHLLKYAYYIEDTEGKNASLHYIKTKEKKEVDFLLLIDGKVEELVEVKLSETMPDPHFARLVDQLKPNKATQVVMNLEREKNYSNIKVSSVHQYLSELPV